MTRTLQLCNLGKYIAYSEISIFYEQVNILKPDITYNGFLDKTID